MLTMRHTQVFGRPGTPAPPPSPPPPSGLVDLSLGKIAYQSSDSNSTDFQLEDVQAYRAVDGSTNQTDRLCSHTNSEPNAWWFVDLGEPKLVTSLNIYLRTDCCMGKWTKAQYCT